MRITVISPHRDDAAFSLSLSIAQWLESGHKIRVLNCFTESQYAPYAQATTENHNPLQVITSLRQSEDERWRRALGPCLQIEDLELKDAPLRLNCSSDVVCSLVISSSDPAWERIRESLHENSFDALVLPLALGGHVDHLTARKGGLPMSGSYPCAFYEDLPYATRPGVFQGISRVASEIDPTLTPIFSSAEAKDVACALVRKKTLVLRYASQIGTAEATEIADYSRRFEGRERLWGNDAWRRSELTFEDAAS